MSGARNLHPEGMAALIAAILVDGDLQKLPSNQRRNAQLLQRALEYRRRQVLEMALEYYKANEDDFANDSHWREKVMRNGMNNRAKLTRANLWK